ncbi:GntR family transcriptional regulator [Marinobacter sp. S6332]|uniref:GntR family transcriptional regulator n=1 Tax=Marinobacter sp. S6332 TaxID=2926403 RepID=UPI001FF460C7|nr:GntR family transcriptional regulator [Marinobacter sp. S6332]MCK0162340.1 GntR family transcriptional regulator [Marinobacter sp. S6332]
MPVKRLIKKESLPEIIANDLRRRILSGELSEGEAIRQEALTEEYGVSRMPVREALKRLAAEGLLNWENNRGGSVVKHSLSEIGEIFDLRALLEVDLYRQSVPLLESSDFALCERLLDEMEMSYAADNVGDWGDLNHAYHGALFAKANRPMTMEFLKRLSLHSDRYVRIHLSVIKQREPAKAEHRALLEHAKHGRIEDGTLLLESHIRRTRDELLEMVAKQRQQ